MGLSFGRGPAVADAAALADRRLDGSPRLGSQLRGCLSRVAHFALNRSSSQRLPNAFQKRRCVAEIMDQPGLDPRLHERALHGLARVNRISGSDNNLWRPIQELAAANAGHPLRLRDMATGGGDVPIRLWQKA